MNDETFLKQGESEMTNDPMNGLVRFIENRRDVGIAYVIALVGLLELFGGHRFYLGRKGTAIIMLILSLTGVGLIITVIWLAIDLFLIPDMVYEFNQKLIDDIQNAAYTWGMRGNKSS
ncbi:MAG: TM2 domain-containing protein [Rhodobacteraceae bacterium]|nr:TM2 domain-containing protein [Paracoccaceae bacterium]